MRNPLKKAVKWVKRQSHGGLSAKGLKSSVKGALKPKNLGWTLGALTLGAAALPGVSLGGMAGGIGKGATKLGGLAKAGAGKLMGGGVQSSGDFVDQSLQGGDIAGAGSRFRKIGDFLGGNDGFGMDDVLKYGKAAGDAYGAYTGAKDQDRYRQLANQEYAANAPLRDAGRTMLMDNSTPDLSGLFQDPTAPQGRYRKVNVGSRGIV